MLGLKSFGYNMDIGHVSTMGGALIGVTLLEDQGVG
jgi:3-phosphoglycerate kinase